ncbi:MAG: type VI secretion system baseplate subunit TssG [Candidatus Zixiibacteriota bacterium]
MTDEMIMPELCSRRHPLHFATALNILGKTGIDIRSVDILAVGEYENYKGEVIEQNPSAGTPVGPGSKIVLMIGYNSAVDYMPYQFFYGLSGSTARTDDWDMQSRKLMAPFDASVIRYTSIAKRDALTFSLSFVEEEHLHRFLKLFDFDSDRHSGSFSELMFWFTLLPMYHHWAGNAELVEKVLTHLAGYECQIIENVSSTFEIAREICFSLGSAESRLAVNSLVGRSFSECDSAYDVIIRDVKTEDIGEFVPGGRIREKVERALDLCMPSNLVSQITVMGEQKRMQIGRKADCGYLGYSSYV